MLGRVVREVWESLIRSGRKPPPAADAAEANPLAEHFFGGRGRLMQKWHHYFDIYHRHFQPFRGRAPVVLEIGVLHGGSLQMWKSYFGPGAQIIGVDVDPRCRELEEDRIRVLIGDQANRAFLAKLREQVPHIDIVIDDGGHFSPQQIASFEELYPHVQPHGIYLCEDLHSSYAPYYNGGYRREGTFIEYAKGLVDRLHAWHAAEPERFAVDIVTRSTYALHFYDSILVVEKKPAQQPVQSVIGRPSF
ncbi:MAG TPA: class I SAM-dependent methyltransferase [Burkholderiales bacterium]|nr:class I SAM-dependent methyltransferase [Burkholderiales bacterium]